MFPQLAQPVYFFPNGTIANDISPKTQFVMTEKFATIHNMDLSVQTSLHIAIVQKTIFRFQAFKIIMTVFFSLFY